MKTRTAVALELTFLVASVFVFRSIWTLLDRYTINSSLMHAFLLVSGLCLSVICVYLLYAEE